MQNLFTAEYQWLWTLGLALALFYPVRQFIWGLSARRADAKGETVDEEVSLRLKKRANFTAALLCFVFSVIYVNQMFQGNP